MLNDRKHLKKSVTWSFTFYSIVVTISLPKKTQCNLLVKQVILTLTSIVTEPNTEEMDPTTARAIAIVRLFSPSKSWLPLILDITIANISSVRATHWKLLNCTSLLIVGVTPHFQNTKVVFIIWDWCYIFHTITGGIHKYWLKLMSLVHVYPKSTFDRCSTPLVFIIFNH